MLRPFSWLRARVGLRQWAHIHAFLVLGLGWGHAIALFPPESYVGPVDLSLVVRMGALTAFGSIIAVTGMIMNRSLSITTAHRGLWVELVGTFLLAGGPLQYLGIQIGFLIQGPFDARYALVWFSYAMLAFMMIRFAILIPALVVSSRQAQINRRRSA